MKTILAETQNRKAIILNTDHAASSYDVPVAIVDGKVYGPDDTLPCWKDKTLDWITEPARQTIASIALENGIMDDPIVQKFIWQGIEI
jgi:hypothetical protein